MRIETAQGRALIGSGDESIQRPGELGRFPSGSGQETGEQIVIMPKTGRIGDMVREELTTERLPLYCYLEVAWIIVGY